MAEPEEDFELQWPAEEGPEPDVPRRGPVAAPRPRPTLTPQLRQEYERLFSTCQPRADHLGAVDRILDQVLGARQRYAVLEQQLGCPWFVPAAVHNLEAGLRFDRHLHNGDPLTARTVRVPAGRPPGGDPPFTWEQSALDALRLKKFHDWKDWSVSGALYKLEEYNGWGYRLHHPEVLSPYLWSFSNHYSRGKYVADGRFDAGAVSKQCGAAALLRRAVDRRLISWDRPEETEVAYVFLQAGEEAQIPLPDGTTNVHVACDFGDAQVRLAVGNATRWHIIEELTVAAGVPVTRRASGASLMASIVNRGPRPVGVLTGTA